MNKYKESGSTVNEVFSREISIDVLIPFHKIDSYLLRCLDSVNASKNLMVRVILIDDRKFEDLEIVDSNDYQILTSRLFLCEYVVIKSNGHGYAAALNYGSSQVKSEFVSILNSDDVTHCGRLASQVRKLINEDADVCVGRVIKFGFFGRIPSLLGSPNVNQYTPNFLLLGAYGADASVVVRATVWTKHFVYREDVNSADIELALRIYNKLKIVGDNEAKYFYRIHKNQVTSKASRENYDGFMQYFQLLQSFSCELALPTLSEHEYINMAAPWLVTKGHDISWKKIDAWQKAYLQTFSDVGAKRSAQKLLQRRNLFLWMRHQEGKVNIFVMLRVALEFIYLSLFGRAR